MLDPLYLNACEELEAQAQRMNALNAALTYFCPSPEDPIRERVLREFENASFLCMVMDGTKRCMEGGK